MKVIKRNGQSENVSFDKILRRIAFLCTGLDAIVDPVKIAIKVIDGLFDGITTSELDRLAAETAAYTMTRHPDFGILASRISASNLQKETPKTFSDAMDELYNHINPRTGKQQPLITPEVYTVICENKERLNAVIDPSLDFIFSYHGFKTLERTYLIRKNNKIIETPQYMFLRISIGIHGADIESAIETYKYMSNKYFIHASPTLFNAGTPNGQLSSCFLIEMKDDSIDGIYDTLKNAAQISRHSGGIGLSIHRVRGEGSYIAGTNGFSTGILKMLKVYDETAKYVNQGGRRPGSIAVYLEPWHSDIETYLEMKLNTGKEEQRARGLFYALWIPDLFMQRVKDNGNWSLMSPDECPGLSECYGKEFEKLYTSYESQGKVRKTVKAQKIWSAIITSQTETGVPYILFKDHINNKTNHQNLGTIKSSNLCVAPETYILTHEGQKKIGELEGQSITIWNGYEWSRTTVVKTNDDAELIKILVSNGAEIECTPYHKFILADGTTRVEAQNLTIGTSLLGLIGHKLNTMYVKEIIKTGRHSATYCVNEPLRHSVIFNGILTGNCCEIAEYTSPEEVAVCNLASIALPVFVDKDKKTFNFTKLHEVAKVITRNLNKVIDITYYPIEEARRSNMRHRPIGMGVQGLADTFILLRMPFESPEAKELNIKIFETIYHGGLEASMELATLNGCYSTYEGSPVSKGILQYDMWGVKPSDLWDWTTLKTNIAKHGVRNSLLVAPMPTATTSQILGFNECFEAFTSNMYDRRVLAGNFIVVNHYLINDLIDLGLWNEDMRQKIISNKGSVQNIPSIPKEIKMLYKTVWEISQRVVIDMAADRGAFVDQSQSMNLHVADPTPAKLTSMLFYAWSKGLKTGCYYLRSQPAVDAIQFTIDKPPVSVVVQDNTNTKEDECPMCSS